MRWLLNSTTGIVSSLSEDKRLLNVAVGSPVIEEPVEPGAGIG